MNNVINFQEEKARRDREEWSSLVVEGCDGKSEEQMEEENVPEEILEGIVKSIAKSNPDISIGPFIPKKSK